MEVRKRNRTIINTGCIFFFASRSNFPKGPFLQLRHEGETLQARFKCIVSHIARTLVKSFLLSLKEPNRLRRYIYESNKVFLGQHFWTMTYQKNNEQLMFFLSQADCMLRKDSKVMVK